MVTELQNLLAMRDAYREVVAGHLQEEGIGTVFPKGLDDKIRCFHGASPKETPRTGVSQNVFWSFRQELGFNISMLSL